MEDIFNTECDMHDFDFLDFSELNLMGYDMENLMENEYEIHDKTDKDPAVFDDRDLNTLFGQSHKSKGNREFVKRFVAQASFPSGSRKYKELRVNEYLNNRCEIFERDEDLFVKSHGQERLIGKVLRPVNKSHKCWSDDCIDRADTYTEEVKGRGSGLGYSLFMHLISIMILSRNDEIAQRCVMEPLEGHDLTVNGITIEITGNNYLDRKSKCNWVINKYYLNTAMVKSEQFDLIMMLSRNEETNDTSGYLGSSYDMEDSPYTNHSNRFHELIRRMTKEQFFSINRMYLSWYSREPDPIIEDIKLDLDNLEYIDKVILSGKNKGSKSEGYPVPFRCFPYGCDYNDVRKWFKPKWGNWKNSTFATLKGDEDVIELCKFKSDTELDMSNMDSMIMSKLRRYFAFVSCELESELLGKVIGARGSYYNEYRGVGVSWNTTKNSLTYSMFYYMYEAPCAERLVGRWDKVEDEELLYYRSATFKMNRGELQHAMSLPTKMVASVSAAVSMKGNDINTNDVISQMMVILCVWMRSNWYTSTISGDMRFIVTTHLAMSNRAKNLCSKQLKLNDNTFKSCDYILCQLYRNYVKNPSDYSKTPLLGLPIRFMSIEKDLSLGMYWHIRKANHANDCMAKLIKAYDQELLMRNDIIKFYDDCYTYLNHSILMGSNQQKFDELMNSCPKNVSLLNIFSAIALVYQCKDELCSVAARQQYTGFSINDMLSDHSSVILGDIIKSGKVSETLNNLVSNLKSKGSYTTLLSLMNKKERIDNTTAIFPKDSKGGDREISANTIENSINRYFRECQMIVISQEMPEDFLKESDKFCPMVENVQSILKSESPHVVSSEDRTFHCGNLHPEMMSVFYLIVACICDIPSVISASASLRVNKHRDVIFPYDFDDLTMMENREYKMVSRMQGKVIRKVPKMRLYYHMQQGFEHTGSGIMNTICCKGHSSMSSELTTELKRDFTFTTADDCIRAYEFKKDCNAVDATKEFVYKPIKYYNQMMMINNDRKYVVSETIAEGNNIAVSSKGMIPQSLIYATLMCDYPSTSCPFADALEIVNRCKSCIYWGMSPNIAMLAIGSALNMYMQKWMVNEDQLMYMHQLGIFPSDLTELLKPKVWSQQLLNSFYAAASEKVKPMMITRSVNLTTGIVRKFSNKSTKDEETFKSIPVNIFSFDHKCDQIIKARLNANKISPMHARPMGVAKRKQRFNDFFNFINKDHQHFEYKQDEIEVSIIIRPMTNDDMLPTTMGMVYSKPLPRMNAIKCQRFLNIIYRDELTEDEDKILKMDEINFITEVRRLEETSSKIGKSFKSPSGLPIILYDNRNIYTTPYCMNFHYHLDQYMIEELEYKFDYKGSVVSDIEMCHWGDGSISLINNEIMAFCKGVIGGITYAFYKKPRGSVECIEIVDKISPMSYNKRGKETIVSLNKPDWSPITVELYGIVEKGSHPLMSGDNTSKLNYGDYIRTNTSGLDIYRQVFNKKNSDIPYLMNKYYKNYPQFSEDKVTIDAGNNYVIYGNEYISMLEVKSNPNSNTTIRINCDLCPPIQESLIVKKARFI